MKQIECMISFVFLVLILFTANTYADSSREQFQQIVGQLRKNPSDSALREKIIRLAEDIKRATFPISGLIPGLAEALQSMKEGSKWRLFLPSILAYGERRAGSDIGPNATLIFQVELISAQ